MKYVLFFLTALISFTACTNQPSKADYAIDPYNREVKAKEVVQTSAYTYVLAEEDGVELWMAVSKADVKAGKTYYFSQVMEMENFHSKELDRHFEIIYFVGNLSDMPIPASGQTTAQSIAPPTGMRPEISRSKTVIEPVEGSISMAELWENRASYENKIVKVVGQVAKYNPGIMSRNWVHIQDGTGTEEFFDLTITTQDMVSPGDVVLFEGKITLKKDFGAGYYYEIIMEEAKATVLSVY